MNKTLFAIALIIAVRQAPAQRLISFVDPMIGSGGHGHVFVGASVPFGAVQVGPENIPEGWDWCSGYNYADSVIIGFSQMHLNGTGIGDLGDVLIMPTTGPAKINRGTQTERGYSSLFQHKKEHAKPGYYAVHLDDYDVDVELTATERVGFHKYHFPQNKEAHILIDLQQGVQDSATDTYIHQVDAHTLKGYRMSTGWAHDQRVYFVIRCDHEIKDINIFNDSTKIDGKKGKGNAIKALITWEQSPGKVKLKVGISPVSSDNALDNLDTETPDWDFNKIEAKAEEKWEAELEKIKIETESNTNKRVFYTALYHTMIDPSLYNDHDRDYRGTDKKVYPHAPFQNYSVFSLWDTYRALQPLYTLIQPERVNDIIQSFLAIYQQQGMMPIWHLEGNETYTMPGVSSVQVLAEAYLKGYRKYDASLAFEAEKNTMNLNKMGLRYDKVDTYIPSDKVGESVAKALEYSISNASVALMAKAMGKDTDYKYFHKRFQNYKLYFDKNVGFFRGRLADGSWNPVFDPQKSSQPWSRDLSEGNGWQYLWLVPEDVSGLIHLLGGDNGFLEKLDSLFIITAPPDPNAPPDISGLIGEYAHGDEPGHQTIYLYSYAGEQWKAAEKARFICQNLYRDSTDGLSGNEDCGQMSAWYVFSALGFYPVFPASGMYALGSPLFDKASIHLEGGKTFTVVTDGNGPNNMYIQKVEWNGKPYTKSYITHEDIMKGGTMKITMGATPNKHFGSAKEDRPYDKY